MLLLSALALLATAVTALRYDPAQVGFNLNENKTAVNPLDYWGEWPDHKYQPSPENWRFPFYTLFLDRFVNGDPSNDDANGTVFEYDMMSNQLRHGGDVKGLVDTLDYLQGMGIKGLYLSGSPLVNEPWSSDGFSPLDLTLLDRHFGRIQDWRDAIDEIHRRGMYVIVENTFATMGDLFGFEGYLNESTPFNFREHNAVWKKSRRYHDFHVAETEEFEDCEYPRFWTAGGERVGRNVTDLMKGCRKSEFDQYGDIAAFGNYPEWQRQLSKFAFVQDRLREWDPRVLAKIMHFSCIFVGMLDIDGFRIDKALQVTVDAQGEFSDHMRQCAKKLGKDNFYIPGEVVSGNAFSAIYMGRGKEPAMAVKDVKEAIMMTNRTDEDLFIREDSKAALDGVAFHYSIYRGLTRFLGLDGEFAAEQDTPVNWVEAWDTILKTNDLVNANTGLFDPRHMYGASNQDVFRWPALKNGTAKQALAYYIITLVLPGVPMMVWGEEQNMYVFDNTANNYIFGRQPMTSALAWQTHGCYRLGGPKYFDFPLDKALYGCLDDGVSRDQRDPSHPMRGLIKGMYEMREHYPVLNDGYYLQQLSNQTWDIYLPGSGDTRTETGLWSVLRSRYEGVQNFAGAGMGNQSVWLVYGNQDTPKNYQFNCSDAKEALLAPFDAGTTVRNLFYPYDEYTLTNSSTKFGFEGSDEFSGCLDSLAMEAWGFKAFVPAEKHVALRPTLTRFVPGHDARLLSTVGPAETETLRIELHFSAQMNCDSITASLTLNSTTHSGVAPALDTGSVSCRTLDFTDITAHVGERPTRFIYTADLRGVANGVHAVTVANATSSDDNLTNAVDRFMFRIGQAENVVVFPRAANYSSTLLHRDEGNGSLWVQHAAAGADRWRYTLNWGSTYSDWLPYTGGNSTLAPKEWSGTAQQDWKGEHVQVQYWSRIAGSSAHMVSGDLAAPSAPAARRFPHLFLHGPFNSYGFDAGLHNAMTPPSAHSTKWKFNFNAEWPAYFALNAWGINPDGQPDASMVLGDVDNDRVLDRIPPLSLLKNVINITAIPQYPYLAYRLEVDDATYAYELVPVGSAKGQMVLYLLLALLPVLTGALAVWAFKTSFYQVKFNRRGVDDHGALADSVFPPAFRRKVRALLPAALTSANSSDASAGVVSTALAADEGAPHRRTVLIATMEYDIEDWAIRIKIGGLGVMAQLMGKNLGHQDLIWVVPCVGGIDYPVDRPAEPMVVTILGNAYTVDVQYHVLRNITYVLLDAPVFRAQTKTEPYPPRMDDLHSAIYYSAWNSCIALALQRFPVDLYHINDYHGAVAPLHLLPRTIPVALSLHNAEFQGLWPMRTPLERDEVCRVFNLDPAVMARYVQFGDVYNLLHAAVSYLRIHQNGFGAVGVSKKYGARAYARYPIFWGLKGVGSLPNPDPTDVGEYDRDAPADDAVVIDQAFEDGRAELKRQAQEWAGLNQDPEADLLVFVGRWSMQKGVDLIADVFPAILEAQPHVQLLCIGPVIDLYGKFAALKLARMMALYPGRVFSKPEFTALPPYIFSGADFALIPSRDEPFGLVAVEFGRKGALGIGSRVGGLGNMPGWWFTIESTTTKHLITQFRTAIEAALASKPHVRAVMRARSQKQRFPVAQWVEDLDILQSTALRVHKKEAAKPALGFQWPLGRKKQGAGGITGLLRKASIAITTTAPGGAERPADEEIGTAVAPEMPSGFVPYQQNPHAVPTFALSPTAHGSAPESVFTSAVASPSGSLFPTPYHSPNTSRPGTSHEIMPIPPTAATRDPRDALRAEQRNSSVLSLPSVVGDKKDFKLQKVDLNFTDATGEYYKAFEKKLAALDGKTSEDALCVEDYLIRSEKKWFGRFHDAKMGRSANASPAPSLFRSKRQQVTETAVTVSDDSSSRSGSSDGKDEFQLGADYVAPRGVNWFLQLRIGDWPVYTIFLAFGQIIAANSYQITLLTGEVGQTPEKLYVVASIYLATSIMWWFLFRRFASVYVLSVPFVFYGLAFFFIGVAPWVATEGGRGWMQNVATAMYAVASSSGSIFFALNFGDEGGAPIESWVYRACVIQGSQQAYVVALWYWGSVLTQRTAGGASTALPIASTWHMSAITLPLAAALWLIGALLYLGLPPYYRQAPGTVPSFYTSLLRRRIIAWFFLTVLLQNYFLSAPYGRSWRYLFASAHAPAWSILALAALFFVAVWAAWLYTFSRLSSRHSWILPVFAIGLGAPRWCQMLWATSGVGSYMPLAGTPFASALATRALWLWLGVLDALQGVGFGMILLQTLTRIHIAFTLVAAQVLGSAATIVARATAPNRVGPGDVFPDFAFGWREGAGRVWFWVALGAQAVVCWGFFKFFRKEQLLKA
ncbi:alpha-1,3-glucan synthase [Geopyxis carbonaria]|nr:alpha-1,3-glucan synthase [Geopyxis carbonaria]